MPISDQAYRKIVAEAWTASQGGQLPKGTDESRRLEGGQSGGQANGQSQKFAHALLDGLKRGGCGTVQEALDCAAGTMTRGANKG